jgi:hypothetical protein
MYLHVVVFQAASGRNFNPSAFITFKIALKLGLPFFKREFADTPPPGFAVLPQLR